MYRSPLLLFYFLQNKIAMFSRRPMTACAVPIFIGLLLFLPIVAGAQTSDSQTASPSGTGLGLSARTPLITGQPVQLSEVVRRSLSEQPAMQAGRARTCQALYRLGLNRAEARSRLIEE